jgi:hypothetical protein
MDDFPYSIRTAYADHRCDQLIAGIRTGNENAEHSLHFSQNEDFFLRFSREIHVPSFSVHHDIKSDEPEASYLQAIRHVLSQVLELLPEGLAGLTYFFDPADIFRPAFYKLYKIEDSLYLYLLRLDLNCRYRSSRVRTAGTNDRTPDFRTRDLYLESEFVPLEGIEREGSRIKAFHARQSVSQTWIGETGKGYMVHGIWMDSSLSKFFTKLFLPAGKSLYPFYPLFCKYKTVCLFSVGMEAKGRREGLALFHNQAGLLYPWMGTIQKALKNGDFSETMPEFQELRRHVPESWLKAWSNLRVKPYLNDDDMKEYRLEY